MGRRGIGAGGDIKYNAWAVGSSVEHHQHYHEAPRPPVEWPLRIGALPPRAGFYQHRSEEDVLHRRLDDGGTTVLTGDEQILSGMGGVGKTQLAADLAHSVCAADSPVDLVVWAAGDRQAITDLFAQAARMILTDREVDQDKELAAQQFLAWLGTSERSWLVVLDDVTAPRDLNGLWPPRTPAGRTLVTTRSRDAAWTTESRAVIPVGVFTAGQSLTYLRRALGRSGRGHRHDTDAQLSALADEMGHLPIALAQAAAYLVDADLDVSAYLELLADEARSLDEALPQEDALPDGHRDPVPAVWEISIRRAQELRPAGLARPVLELAGVLNGADIPDGLFVTEAALEYLGARRSDPGMRAPDAREVREALRVLNRLNLLDHRAADTARSWAGQVRIHQLVQRSVREATPDFSRVVWAAADALESSWPETERDQSLSQRLRANVPPLRLHGLEALWLPAVHSILNSYGTSLGDSGAWTAAAEYYVAVSVEAHRFLGERHPQTLGLRASAAHWRGQTGDAAGAAAALAELLPDQELLQGPRHPATLTLRTNIAGWRGEAGDAAGAAHAFESLVPLHEEVLGRDHHLTLNVRHNLAAWRGKAGDAAGAAEAFAQVLADRERVLGPDHPDTLSTRNTLATWRGRAGDPVGAVSLLERLVADCERLRGRDHPSALSARHNLADWRGAAGRPAEAAAELVQVVVDMQRVLGPEHFMTLEARHDVATLRAKAGNLRAAMTELEEVLVLRERTLGRDHPASLATRHNLAGWRGEAGSAGEAVTAFHALAEDMLRIFGPRHPDTLTVRGNLANWLGQAGDPEAAIEALETLLSDQAHLLSPGHPATFHTRHNLAVWRSSAGDQDGAVRVLETLVPAMQLALSPDHPEILSVRHDLACLRINAGLADVAERELEQVLADRQRVLGPDHPDVLTTARDLTTLRERRGNATTVVGDSRGDSHSHDGTGAPDPVHRLVTAARSHATALADAEDLPGAVRVLEELVAELHITVGPDHPAALMARNQIAAWRGIAGNPDRAVEELEALLTDMRRVAGEEHPATLTVRHNLAAFHGQAGDLSRADAEFTRLLADEVRVLGENHPQTKTTRDNLAHWRTRADESS
ncbi:FxSxx-COOH system tetratricopeptide repeat protein [Streptomyces sp. NBC_00882]|uniref:FxSxx-COOH system tetratricopeptide repeat protein n=1 Tax=Streptomyces TaxID=1883 RepID=UPI00386FD808|nr:FxSxx-COOH system tetratricopeptide repeat protein [Streptomyces sp. NBC_00882]WSZ59764.1 FxSxx-COOH system tetratricopeptide repeat protein [Streptomyces canus]